MKYCPNCGKEIYEDEDFCPYCGASQNANNYPQRQQSNESRWHNGEQNQQINNNKGTIYLIIGWICAIISLFTYHLIFAIIAIIMAVLERRIDRHKGNVLLTFSIIFLILGIICDMILGALAGASAVLSNYRYY